MKMNEDETNVIEDETDDNLGGEHLRGDGTATGGA